MIKRACRLEVENPISEKNGELTDEDRVRQAEQVKEQAAYDAFQHVLENDPAGPRRLNGILELMILEGRCSVPDSHDADLVNGVLHTTNKGNVVFGANERGWGEIFGDLSHHWCAVSLCNLKQLLYGANWTISRQSKVSTNDSRNWQRFVCF